MIPQPSVFEGSHMGPRASLPLATDQYFMCRKRKAGYFFCVGAVTQQAAAVVIGIYLAR